MWSWCRDMARQADLQELAQTVFVAAVFAFMLSKLVSMMMAIRSSIQSGSLRLERVPLGESAAEEEDDEKKKALESSSSSDEKEGSVHSLDSEGDRADISGLSEGRADFSEVSESGGIEETSGRPQVEASLRKDEVSEQEGIAAHQSLAPAVLDLKDGGYEPSTSSSTEAEGLFNTSGTKAAQVVEEDDTSDWEGVESTELDEAFGAASSYIATLAGGLKVPNEIQLQLYGLYKVATEGPCHAPQPSALKMTARAKWNAWQKLGSISQEEAMQRYIQIVTEISPEWTQAIQKKKGGEGTSGSDVQKRSQMGPVFSTLSYEDKGDEGTLEGLHIAAREGSEPDVLRLLNQGVPVDVRDSDKRTALHWAADRGHLKMAEMLISKGADIQAKDKEGQTALHYATICEQEQIAKFLLEKGADPEDKDAEGATPRSFCPINWSWMSTRET